jgi:hypothetical protein
MPPEPSQSWRNNDPPTSQRAGGNNRHRATQRDLLLSAVLFSGGPMIAYEAAVAAGLDRPGPCPWKRFSELHRDYGYLEPTGVERPGPSPSDKQREMRITEAGREYLKSIMHKEWY